MKVSIIIPVYNVESYLEECLNSVYNQTYKDFEVIAIDDGSMDRSLDILMNFKNKYLNFHVYTQQNKGLGATRNVGMAYASGEFIYFLDSDDVIEKNLLELCVGAMEHYDAELVGFQATIFGDINGKNKDQYIYSHRCSEMNKMMTGCYFFNKYYKKIPILNTPLLFFRKDFILRNQLSFLEGILHEDVDFYYKMVVRCSKMVLLDEKLYNRRYRPASIMTSESSNGLQRRCDLIKIYIGIGLMDVNECLQPNYICIALKGLRNVIEDMVGWAEVPDVIIKLIKDFYYKSYEKVATGNLLNLCEYFLGQTYLSRLIKEPVNKETWALMDNRLQFVFDKTGLYKEGELVGIYGIGDVAKKFLQVCEMVNGVIPQNIILIETNTKNEAKRYKGKLVKNCEEINFGELSCVIVSSELYDVEIEQNIRKIDNNVCVYKITTDF